LTIISACSTDDGWVEGQRSLRVYASVIPSIIVVVVVSSIVLAIVTTIAVVVLSLNDDGSKSEGESKEFHFF